MSLHDLAAAIRRAETALQRRPDLGLHDDAAATAIWQSGTRIVSQHANGTHLPTDMPSELGGSGDLVTPGWLFRAGLASCFATTIAMRAAADGIELDALEVRASSRSDTRGLLGMADGDGGCVYAGPQDMLLSVRISAPGIAPERLHALVEDSQRCSPMPNALQQAVSIGLQVDIAGG